MVAVRSIMFACWGGGTAVVTFEKSEVADSVMKRRQEIDGCPVTLEPFGQTVSQQVFGKVSGRLDPNAFGMNYSSMKTILQKLQDEAIVEWKEIFDGFVVSGTFQQMKEVNTLLKTKLKDKKPLRREVPLKQLGEARATGHTRLVPHCDLTESNTCPNRPSEKGQVKIKQTERTHVKTSKRQTAVSETAQVRVNQTYKKSKIDFSTSHANNPVSKIDSFSVYNYPPFEPSGLSISSTSENYQQGLIGSLDETDFESELAVSRSESKAGGHPFHALPRERDSDMGSKDTCEESQVVRKTKQHLADKSLVESLEVNGGKRNEVIPDDHCPSLQKYKSSNSCAVQSKPNLFDKTKSESKSVAILPALNKVSTQDNVGKTETDECESEAEVTVKGAESNSFLDETDFEGDITIFKNGPRLGGDPLHALPQEKDPEIGSNDTCEENQVLGETKQRLADKSPVEFLEVNESKSNEIIPDDLGSSLKKSSDGYDVQPKPTLLDRKKSTNTSVAISSALNKVSTQEYVRKSETDECEREAKVPGKTSQGQESGAVIGKHWEFVTSTGITVTLLLGDITSQNVDVLLCPANPTLSYDEGLSKLILDKGGQAMKDECFSITQIHGPLNEGATVITSGGNPPYKSVLHAVLPCWKNQDQVHNEKDLKRRIHKCLKEGLVLASGYRMKSISLPPLGQSWNGIPVEMSAEVIARVVAMFSKTVGPMHSGITNIRIVCEDEESLNVFVKEFASCSVHGLNPFFVSRTLKKELEKAAEGPEGTMRRQKKGKIKVPLLPKESPVIKSQKHDSKPGSVPFVNGINDNTTESIFESHVPNLPKEDKVDEEDQSDSPAVGVNPPKHLDEEANEIQGGCYRGDSNDTKAKYEWQVCETKMSLDTSSFAELADVSVLRTFEAFQVKDVVKLEEETVKCMYVQDKLLAPEIASTTLPIGDALHQNQGVKVTATNKNTKHASQRPKIGGLSVPKEQSRNSERTKIYAHQDIPGDDLDHRSSQSDQPTSDSFSVCKNNNILMTSPTVDGLLNADLHLGFQGLELWHGKKVDDRSRGSESFMEINTNSKENLTFPTYQEAKFMPPLGTSFFVTEADRKRITLEKKTKKGRADSNLGTKTDLQLSGVEESKTGEELESAEKDEFDETRRKEGGGTVPTENYLLERKPCESKPQPLVLCALCQQLVDHPDLSNPSVCLEHRFCDDCILRAFTISSSCPACMDKAGLIITENVIENRDTQQQNSNAASSQNHDVKSQWTAIPAPIQANQPPGQMMWKKYEASLPGFEGYSSVAVTFCFYDGIQSSEHPNPGEMYKGTSCVAYIPATQEGTEVLKLLRKAFDARLLFTVSSSTSNGTRVIVVDGIELKTSVERDSRNGYPDLDYLSRLRQQLYAKGIR